MAKVPYSCEKEYKKLPFPKAMLISFTIIAIVITIIYNFIPHLLNLDAINQLLTMTIFDADITREGLILTLSIIGYLILILIGGGIFKNFVYNYKTYRGLGLYNYVNTFCCFLFFITLAWLGHLYMNDALTTPTIITYILGWSFSLFLKGRLKKHAPRCPHCQCLHSFGFADYERKKLGIFPKFHTAGGYTSSSTSTVSVNGQSADVKTSYYVPSYQVYDGMYEKVKTTATKTCKVCGYKDVSSYTLDHKVD